MSVLEGGVLWLASVVSAGPVWAQELCADIHKYSECYLAAKVSQDHLGNSQQLICVFRSFRFRPFHLNIFSADKLNKDPISLYTQPLPVIDLCLQPAACSGLSPLSALQLTSANKGISLVVQHPTLRLDDYLCANFRGLESQVPKVQ